MPSEFSSVEENFVFWKNLIIVGAFLVLTPLTIATSLLSLISLKKSDLVKADTAPRTTSYLTQSGVKVYASLPSTISSVSGQVEVSDARQALVEGYLTRYNSPLLPYAPKLIQEADKNGLDFRLITAIAQQESNLCKIIPPGGHNCWGWGIHSEGTLGFNSFEEGIEIVSKGVKEKYIDKGLTTPEEIMTKYTPQSNGSWAAGVNKFMSEME